MKGNESCKHSFILAEVSGEIDCGLSESRDISFENESVSVFIFSRSSFFSDSHLSSQEDVTTGALADSGKLSFSNDGEFPTVGTADE
jgi:hypothetical protein